MKMKSDTNCAIGESFANAEEMRQAMITIAKHVQDRGEQQRWAEHLRFLTPRRCEQQDRPEPEDGNVDNTTESDDMHAEDVNEIENEADGSDGNVDDAVEDDIHSSDSGEKYCSCSYHDSVQFRRAERDLRLTSPDEIPGCIYYVAVSYCWSSSSQAIYTKEPFAIIDPSGAERQPSCPSSLLDRVVQFAAWKQMEFIWIDQECINQADPLDQSVGIQAMDLVYQQAEYSLAVLEICVTEQRHLNALEKLYENGPDLGEEELAADIVDAIKFIMSDPWFQRAWCLQESTSGNRQMTLLIRCNEGLDVPLYMESEVKGCFELDLPWLHNMISSLPTPLEAGRAKWSSQLQQDVEEIMDAWYANMPPDSSTDFNIESRTVCNAAQALSHLELRQNSVVSDRLAIMANLCQYAIRLDPVALDELGFNFSICAFTLAVLNGDFSIQVGYDDYIRSRKGGRKGLLLASHKLDESAIQPFSWSLPLAATINCLSYFDHDANPLRAKVTSPSLENGLAVEGCLYVADCTIDLQALAQSFVDGTYPKPPGVIDEERADPAVPSFQPRERPDIKYVHFLLQLLCTLRKEGFSGLVQYLWSHFRLQGTTKQRLKDPTIVAYYDAPFEEVIDVQTADIKWSHPIPSRLSPRYEHLAIRTHPFINLDVTSMIYIMNAVLQTGKLLASRPVRSSRKNSSYTAIFEITQPETKIFAPRMNSLLRPPSGYGWYPSSWVVEEVHMHSLADIDKTSTLKCRRSVFGTWEGDEECAETVFLL